MHAWGWVCVCVAEVEEITKADDRPLLLPKANIECVPGTVIGAGLDELFARQWLSHPAPPREVRACSSQVSPVPQIGNRWWKFLPNLWRVGHEFEKYIVVKLMHCVMSMPSM
jgi:hypothetical protein